MNHNLYKTNISSCLFRFLGGLVKTSWEFGQFLLSSSASSRRSLPSFCCHYSCCVLTGAGLTRPIKSIVYSVSLPAASIGESGNESKLHQLGKINDSVDWCGTEVWEHWFNYCVPWTYCSLYSAALSAFPSGKKPCLRHCGFQTTALLC